MTSLSVPLAHLDERYARLRLTQPGAERALRDSLSRVGQLHPLVACFRNDQFAVVDGFKRLHAARALGLSDLTARVFEMTETAAIASVLTFNRQGRGLSDLEQALCVRALVREHGLTQLAAGELLGRDKSWVYRRLALVERLSDTVADDVRAGLLSVSVARELTRLPRGNQPEVATAISRASLTARESARLVSIVQATSGAEARRFVLDHPRQALDAVRTDSPRVPRDVRLGPAAQALSSRLCTCLRSMSDVRALFSRSSIGLRTTCTYSRYPVLT